MLFRISRPGLKDSFLFGTFHLHDERMAPISAIALSHLAQTEMLAIETTEDAARLRGRTLAHLRQISEARPGHAADQLLDAKSFADLTNLMAARGLAAADAGRLRPTVLALMLDLPVCAQAQDRDQPPYQDLLLVHQARRENKPVIGLETLAEQIEILGEMDADGDRRLLQYIIRSSAIAEDILETSLQRYLARDTMGMVDWMRAPSPSPDRVAHSLPPQFLDRLLNLRSQRMYERLKSHLVNGGVFVAVGAAHLPGEHGLIKHLADGDYQVQRIY